MSHAGPDGGTAELEEFCRRKGDIKILAPCCDLALYTPNDLTSASDSVLYIYDRFLEFCPPDRAKWYTTENMKQHKACTPRALKMLPSWLKPDAPKRPIINIHIKDGDHFADASEYSFWVWGSEEGDRDHGVDSNVIRCAFPPEWCLRRPDEFVDYVVDICNRFPFQSGHAGLALETTIYEQEASETAAWQLSMRHPGFDIANLITDFTALRNEAIKGVNWLTIINDEFADQIGGIETLTETFTSPVEVIRVTGGVVLRAGDAPRPGDVNRRDNLPEYRAVYKAVSKLQEPMISHYGSLDLPGGTHYDDTRDWLKRFSDGQP